MMNYPDLGFDAVWRYLRYMQLLAGWHYGDAFRWLSLQSSSRRLAARAFDIPILL